VTYPNGVVCGYSYDAKNRLTNLAAAGGAGTTPANFGYAYTLDAAGAPTRRFPMPGLPPSDLRLLPPYL